MDDVETVNSVIHLPESKCCLIGAMISKTAKIETTFEIISEETTEGLYPAV
jgi:uncharacterized OsmC-like protein